MFVDYDNSSGEETPPTKAKPVPKPAIKEPVKQAEPPKRKVKLPSALNFLNEIPNSSLKGAKEPEEEKIAEIKDETYNNMAPPTFSLKEQGELDEKVFNKYEKRRLPREYLKDVESDVMDKFVKLNDDHSGHNDKMMPEKPTGSQKKPAFIPNQLKTKRANIPTLE